VRYGVVEDHYVVSLHGVIDAIRISRGWQDAI